MATNKITAEELNKAVEDLKKNADRYIKAMHESDLRQNVFLANFYLEGIRSAKKSNA